jgi:hypothetical protein
VRFADLFACVFCFCSLIAAMVCSYILIAGLDEWMAGGGLRWISSLRCRLRFAIRLIACAAYIRSARPPHCPAGLPLPFGRSFVYRTDNAGVIVNPKGEMKGSAITGPIAKECADMWPRIASAAGSIL